MINYALIGRTSSPAKECDGTKKHTLSRVLIKPRFDSTRPIMNRLSDRSSLFLGVKGVNSGILEKFQINRDEGIGNFPSALSNDRFSSFA